MNIFTERVIDTAIYRNVRLSFWTDNKVIDEFTPEDKYFYLYLLTNPQTNLCGCYEISYKSMSEDTGYNKDTCLRLLKRFDEVHNVIKFNESTKEILILNWYKYNWSSSAKTITGVISAAKYIKCEKFRNYVLKVAESVKNGNKEPVRYPIEASVSVSDTVSDSVTETDTVNSKKNSTGEDIKKIVTYLNEKCGTHYRCNTANTRKHITARFADGYTVSDFITVIDKKSAEWQGTKFELYLRPDTLFGSKFESYLNQQIKQKDSTKEFLGGWGL